MLANGTPLVVDEPVRVWSGEKVQLKNAGRDKAFFAWDYCARQPRASVRLRQWASSIAAALAGRRAAPRPTP